LAESDKEQTTGSRFTDCIFIAGYYGFGNTGDEAILASLRAELQPIAPDAHLIVMSENPAETAARHDVEAIHWSDPVARLDAVERSRLVIIGGGGLFHDYWGTSRTLFSPGTWGMSLYLTVALYASFRHVPIMLWAVGVGPLFSGLGRATTLAICRLASAITVRDRFSRQQLEALGVPKDKIQVTADPVFSTPPMPLMTAAVHGIIAQTATGNTPMIGVSVRHWDFAMDASVWEKQVAEALDILARRSGASFVLISYQATGKDHLDDVFAAHRVHAAMRSGAHVTIVPETLLVEETWALIGACDGMVAMRFHSGVAAATQGVPFVTVSYDFKVTALTDELELPELNIEIAAVDGARIARVLETAMRDRNLREELLHKSELLRERGGENALRAKALLAGEVPRPKESLESFETFLGNTLRNQVDLLAEAEDRFRLELQSTLHEETEKNAQLRAAIDHAQRGKQEALDTVSRLAEAQSRLTRIHEEAITSLDTRISELTQRLEAQRSEVKPKPSRAQSVLDAIQKITPERLRVAVRPVYLPLYRWAFSIPSPAPEVPLAMIEAKPEAKPEPIREPEPEPETPEPPIEEPPVKEPPENAPPKEEALEQEPTEEPPPRPVQSELRELPINYEPLISVVLPVWNHKDFVADAVRSVLAQTWRNLELIVVDDGSDEDLIPELREAIGNDTRVLVVRRPHEGLPPTLNAGFRYARGEFYTWTSADNIMKPHMLEALAGFLLRRPDVAMVYADMDLIDAEGNSFTNSHYRVSSQRPEATHQLSLPREIETLGLAQDNFLGASFLYRADIARVVGDYDDSRLGVEDYDYWLRIAEVAGIEHLDSDECLYSYRVHSDSISGRHAPAIVGEAEDLLRHHRERLDFYARPFNAALVVDERMPELGLTAANLAIELRHERHCVGEFDCLKAPELLPPWIPVDPEAKTIVVWFGPTPAWFHEFLNAHPRILYFNWLSSTCETGIGNPREWRLCSSRRTVPEGARWSLMPASHVYFEDLQLCLKARGAAYPLWGVDEFQPPLFLYLGPVTESFIDWTAVESLATEYPSATILFVSTHEEHVFDPRTKIASIKFPGAIGSGDWYSYLSRADLLIAPLADTPGVDDFTYDVLMSYLAAGKPTLATTPAQRIGFADIPNARFSGPADFGTTSLRAQQIQPDLNLASAYMQSKSPRAFAAALLASANSMHSIPQPVIGRIEVEPPDLADSELIRGLKNLGYEIACSDEGAESAWRRGIPVLRIVDDDAIPTDLFVTHYIAASQATARQFPSWKVSVIPNGIDVERPRAFESRGADEDFVVLHSAPIKSTHAQIHAIAAVEALRERCPRLRLVIAGCAANRQYAAEVQAYIDEAGLEDRVQIRCAGNYYQLADAFLHTSLVETATVETIEAMHAGLPLILTNAGGAADLVNGNGIIIPPDTSSGNFWQRGTNHRPDNLEAITAALCDLYDHPEAWRERGKSGQSKVRQQFDLKLTVARYAAEIDKLLAKHYGRGSAGSAGLLLLR
jgi:polysaccharide pyruvyl transferase CsaB